MINGDAMWTDNDVVTLTLDASDVTSGFASGQMHFQNDGGSWSTPEAYVASTSWTLRDLDGAIRTVYVEIWDSAGNVSIVGGDSIGLDRSDPNIGTFTIHDRTDDSDVQTDELDVRLEIAATDAPAGPFKMQFKNYGEAWSGWEDYATSRNWKLAATGGIFRQVYIQVNDQAGHTVQADDVIKYAPP